MSSVNSIPIIGQDTTSSAPPSGSTNSSSSQASNQLNANSFITLLTTQLQAQSPLNPLDPSQMVSELTQMNTFEQLLQIRQDMDVLVGAAQSSGSGGAGSGGSATAQAASAAALHAGLLNSLNPGNSAQRLTSSF